MNTFFRGAIPFAVVLLMAQCQPDPPGEGRYVPPKNGEKKLEVPAVQLMCEALPGNDQDLNPRHAVYFLFSDSKVKLGEVATCTKIHPDGWLDLGIPADALEAAGGWWAGLGQYFYVILDDTTFRVFQILIDEAEESSSLPTEVYTVKIPKEVG